MHTRLTPGPPDAFAQALALTGLAGIGKTQVAIEYAYRYASTYLAVFWLTAETVESLMRSLQQIAELLPLPESQVADQAQMVRAVQRWFTAHPGWLLIGDNVEDLDQFQAMFPSLKGGALLLTTRRQALGTVAEPLPLPLMSEQEGTTLLLRRAGILGRSVEGTPLLPQEMQQLPAMAQARELVKLLGGLPLALDQAGAYLEETGCGVAEYVQRYHHQRKEVLARRGNYGGTHPDSVTTTLLLSIAQVSQEHPAAGELLRLCAFLSPEALPEELLVAGASHLGPVLGAVMVDPYQFDLVLATLRSASVVMRSPETRTLSVHRLVQAVLQDQMEPAERRLWCERVIRMLNATYPEGTFANRVQCERYLAQALACVPLMNVVENDLPETGELLYKVGSYLLERGRYKEATSLLERAMAQVEQRYGANHSALLLRLKKRAELCWKQGKYKHSELLYRYILGLEETYLGSDHLQTAETCNNLAALYWTQGKYEEAEPLYQRALRTQEQRLGLDHSEIAVTASNLATLYQNQGKYEEAEPLYQRALTISEQRLGPHHPKTVKMCEDYHCLLEQKKGYMLRVSGELNRIDGHGCSSS